MNVPTVIFDVCRDYLLDQLASQSIDRLTFERIAGKLRARDIVGLSTIASVYPEALQNRDFFRVLRQVEAFFKKNDVFADAVKCQQAALLSFLENEQTCRVTNQRLDFFCDYPDQLDPDIALWISRMQHIISATLGPFEDFLAILPKNIRLTSGATSTLSRRQSLPPFKLNRKMDASYGAQIYLKPLAKFFGLFEVCKFRHTDANRVVTVPKDWKTDRTIACEPTGNLPLQLAFDAYAKIKLKRKLNVDLSDQSRNQELARMASTNWSNLVPKRTGSATIDLKAASDTVAYNTVALLFPWEWLQYLVHTRSARYEVKGIIGSELTTKGTYAKFSSMGNGATFALESLIFAAACKAIGSHNFSVYGDDIIIETELLDDLLKLFKHLGFTINASKSYSHGPFRESCGTDWHGGVNVTPFYLRTWSWDENVLCHNVNGLAAIAGPELGKRLVALVKERKLPLVPFNLDSMGGVFITARAAYDLGLIRTHTPSRNKGINWIPSYKAFVTKTPMERISGVRASLYWHFTRFFADEGDFEDALRVTSPYLGQAAFVQDAIHYLNSRRSEYECSLVPTICHKYVRKWVRWVPPPTETPVHLYWWTDLLSRD